MHKFGAPRERGIWSLEYLNVHSGKVKFKHAVITLGRDSCFQHGQMLISDIQIYKAASRIEVWSTPSSIYNYENIKQMSVTVRVTDSRGLYATGVIEITIMDENDPPLIVSTKEFYVQENAELGTEIGRIIADDPDYSRDYGKRFSKFKYCL